MKKRFSEEQIIGFLREAEAGMPIKDLCRQHGFSEASYYLWRSKFGGMSVPDAKRLKDLEAENTRLKKLLAGPSRCSRTTSSRMRCEKSGDRAGAQVAGAEHGRERAERAARVGVCTHERQLAALRAAAGP